eukprot:TRINITY_DN28366_c0_g1_i1.p1 TRINITY_DN28366_c0_g1~~TRINITY_DN28366_c0_g1_i1.p1  ORF type:complete len:149 (+),score=35.42 TRINITY_DN28366_c0_g1_i1:92-538(+)
MVVQKAASALVAAIFIAQPVASQEASAAASPTPPAPPPVPAIPVEATTKTTTVDADVIMDLNVKTAMERLEKAGFRGKRGAWIYGDHESKHGVDNVVDCVNFCMADSACSHWNYHPGNDRCDLKSGNGGFNGDARDWVSGDVARASDL